MSDPVPFGFNWVWNWVGLVWAWAWKDWGLKGLGLRLDIIIKVCTSFQCDEFSHTRHDNAIQKGNTKSIKNIMLHTWVSIRKTCLA